MHRVTDLPSCAAAGGCFSVTGILFELVDGPDNPLLDAIWATIPEREGVSHFDGRMGTMGRWTRIVPGC